MIDKQIIRVAILDDHQGIIDGYRYRLDPEPDIQVVADAMYGEELQSLLSDQPIDVLLLDVRVPTSAENSNPYPILYTIPNILERYPEMSLLVISVEQRPALLRSVMDAGANGYILKDDPQALRQLPAIIRSVAGNGIYLSEAASTHYEKDQPAGPKLAPRQQEALSLCAAYPNLKTAELARRMGIEHSTFRNLLSSAYLRLNVRSRAGAILEAQKLGLLTPPVPPDS